MTTSRRPQGRPEASPVIVGKSLEESPPERLDDSHDAPEGLPGDDDRDDLPFAFNEWYHYGRGDDDRLVSDISERYPEASSGNVGSEQPALETATIKSIVKRLATRSEPDAAQPEKALASYPFAPSNF